MKRIPHTWLAPVLLVLAISVTGQSVSAQPADADKPAPTTETSDQQAKQLFQDGDMHYAAGRYEMALENFSKAYELSKRPNLLFNIANVHERLGNYQAAADSLRTYVELPTATDVSSTKERIKRLELNAEQQKKREEAEQGNTQQSTSVSPPLQSNVVGNSQTTNDTPRAEGPSRLPAILVSGLGLVLIGGGITSGILASNAGSDAEALCVNGLCSTAAQPHIDDQKQFALISDISIGVGIATLGIGAYLLLTSSDSPKEKEEGMAFGAGPTNSGWGVSMMGNF